jgi:predicted lipoprotein with Yx(FWY)xxD motif
MIAMPQSLLVKAATMAAAATSLVVLAACASGSSSSTTSSQPAAAAPSSAAAPASGGAGTGAALSTATSKDGTILVDSTGKSIYILTSDKPNGASACTTQCLQFWPAVAAPSPLPTSLSGITAKLGTFMAADGSSQLTINGYPAYTFSMDSGPGMISGQGVKSFGGVWWLVTPSGSWITTAAASASDAASSSSSKSGGGGYGY